MTKRLQVLASLIEKCKTFADVGCDHGYISEYVLKNDLANKVIISDISKKSLQKAQTLLKGYEDKVLSYNCDGVKDYDGKADQIFIAGMGGEEIAKIIKNIEFLPEKFILCPHKNAQIVRELLLKKGYYLKRDFTFLAGSKFYDAVVAIKGNDEYSTLELIFGRENLQTLTSDFIEFLHSKKVKYQNILKAQILSKNQVLLIKEKLNQIEEILNEH